MRMELLSEYLGGYEDFSRAELKGLLEAYGGRVVRDSSHYMIFQTEIPTAFIKRATFSRRIGKVISNPDSDDVGKGREFAIRERSEKDKDSLIDETARMIRGKVNLDNPEVTFFIYNYDSPIFTELLYERRMDNLQDPRYKIRPMNHPSSISPLVARGMINIAGLKEGDSFIDPFAGTGTYLIEGFRMGIRGFGIDKNIKMVNGGNLNLAFFSFPENITLGDFSKLTDLEMAKAIVTDPPYGRGSKLFSQSRLSLYKNFFSLMADLPIRKIFCLPDQELLELAMNFINLDVVARIRVHKSLTRLVIRA